MANIGKLFVFEGPDGVGKTTLSKWCADTLKCRQRRPVIWSSFPGHETGTLGDLVHKLHHDTTAFGIRKLEPASLQLLHVAAHIDAIESRFQKWIGQGKIIVLDRFWWSTWVYGSAAGANTSILKAMIALEKQAWRNIKPVKIFLVERGRSNKRKHNSLQGFYAQLAHQERKFTPVIHIHNDGSIEEAQQKILSFL
jgi:dTMP kinase